MSAPTKTYNFVVLALTMTSVAALLPSCSSSSAGAPPLQRGGWATAFCSPAGLAAPMQRSDGRYNHATPYPRTAEYRSFLHLRGGGGVAATASAMAGSSAPAGDDAVRALIEKTRADASQNVPFSEEELDTAIRSLKLLVAGLPDAESAIDWKAYRNLLQQAAHLPHKDWARTDASSKALAGIVKGPDNAIFDLIFERVLVDGNWKAAAEAASARPQGSKPWAVLVTGVNGIRKTSSVYQPWFKEALKKALAEQYPGEEEDLPDGTDSFFRQLDYMIATVANEDFKNLYKVQDIGLYAALKDTIFMRYRTLAEMLGVLLLREAQARRLNVMVETSGRDVAMFKYVDAFFPEDEYRKLVVHFTINDIAFAERSVDTRMVKEMADGRAAMHGDTAAMIRANAGGPYGSAVLKGVQSDSQKVWEGIRAGGGDEGVGRTWCKASIAIHAKEERWEVRAAGHDTAYSFGPPRQ